MDGQSMASWLLAMVFVLGGRVEDAAATASDASDLAAAWRAGLSWARALGGAGLEEARGLGTMLAPEEAPEQVARFYLSTRAGLRHGAQELSFDDPRSVQQSAFNASLGTKVLVHGYLGSRRVRWVRALAAELLRRGSYNVIAVDWGGLSGSSTIYPVAAARTKIVGQAIAALIRTVHNATGVGPETFHIIGHSLGAHVAGYAGSMTPGLGRITGLDPAGPGFEYASVLDRLDPSDATFVDAIHTDAPSFMEMLRGNAGFGMSTAVGHADFYPNGGRSQPACQKAITETTVWDFVTCDHDIAAEYFIQSVRGNCQFVGVQCSGYWAYSGGACSGILPGGARQTNVMGLGATKPQSGSTTYYLTTLGTLPYCASPAAAAATTAATFMVEDAA